MPVLINTGSLKYKDPNTGEFIPLNQIGDDLESVIAPKYSELTFPVSKGSLCFQNGSLYKAKQAIATTEAWTPDHWEETNVEEVIANKSEIDDTAGAGIVNKTWSADKLTTEFDNVIAVQDTQPSATENKIWIPSTQPQSVQVATYAELTELSNEVKDKFGRENIGDGLDIEYDETGEATVVANVKQSDITALQNAVNEKANKTDTVLDTTLSRGRTEESDVGEASMSFGIDNTASGKASVAIGEGNVASGYYSVALGCWNTASGDETVALGDCVTASGTDSFAEGCVTVASGDFSHAQGEGAIANLHDMCAMGAYNVEGAYHPEWVADTQYEVGDRVVRTSATGSKMGYVCIKANKDSTFKPANWGWTVSDGVDAVTVGNGRYGNRSNAYMLDWDGNEHLAGDVYVNCNSDSTGGDKVATKKDTADIIITSASGSIAAISDGADDLPIESMTVQIEPVQDLHGYDRPWPAGGVKNKFDSSQFSTSASASILSWQLTPGVTYTFSSNLPNNSVELQTQNTDLESNKNIKLNNPVTFTTTGDGTISIRHYNGTGVPLADYWFQCEEGSTATAYMPYSNICPISGRTGAKVTHTGKNLWNPEIEYKTAANLKIGGVIASQTPLPDGSLTLSAGTYVVSISEAMSGIYVAGANGSNIAVAYNKTSLTFTVPTKQACSIMLYKAGITIDVWDTYDVQLEIGSTATAYEPYQGETYPITWESAGTAYGATLNPVTGELVVDTVKYRVPLLTESQFIVASSNYIKSDACDGFLYLNPPMNPSVGPQPLPYTPCCNMFSFGKNSIWSMTGYSNCFTLNNNQLHLNIANDLIGVTDYTQETQETVRTKIVNYLNNLYNSGNYIEVCYKITPTTYTLTPTEISTLLGYNAIWADCGDVDVDYRADTKLYVEKHSGISDVKVNGSSVVTDGVANVPISSSFGQLGVVKTENNYGIKSNNGRLYIDKAGASHVKAGADQYRPVAPSNQHESTFYGLAKAAGDTTQASSSNAVGTYTENAKSSISQMLNAPETISGTTPTITAKAGVRYICGECSTLTITAPASGCIDVTFESGSTPTVLTITPPSGMTMKWANGFDPTALEANTTYEINILDGCLGVAGSWT